MEPTSRLMLPPTEQRQFGRYRLLYRIARGDMADVHLARLTGPDGFQKLVAIKRIFEHASCTGGRAPRCHSYPRPRGNQVSRRPSIRSGSSGRRERRVWPGRGFLLAIAVGTLLGCRFDSSGLLPADGAREGTSSGDQLRSKDQALDGRSGAERAAADRQSLPDSTSKCATKFGGNPGFLACYELWTDGLQRCIFQLGSSTAKSCKEACLDWRCAEADANPSGCLSTEFVSCESLNTAALCTCAHP